MDSLWTKGLKGEHRDKRKAEVLNYRNAFDALSPLLQELEKHEKESDYESPSWAFKQADTNGYNRALKRVLNLIRVTNPDSQGD